MLGNCLPVLDYITEPDAGSVWSFAREPERNGRDYIINADTLGLPICTATLKDGCEMKVSDGQYSGGQNGAAAEPNIRPGDAACVPV